MTSPVIGFGVRLDTDDTVDAGYMLRAHGDITQLKRMSQMNEIKTKCTIIGLCYAKNT